MKLPEARVVIESHLNRAAAIPGEPRFEQLLHTLDHHPRWGLGLPHRARITSLRVTSQARTGAPLLQAAFGTPVRWYAVSWRDGVERQRRNLPTQQTRQEHLLFAAMRGSVSRQMSTWRHRQSQICAHCHARDREMHVDHVDPPFVQLRDAFLQQWSAPLPEVFAGKRSSGRARLQPHMPFTVAWQQYHRQRARYQMLCKTCNLRKGNRDMSVLRFPGAGHRLGGTLYPSSLDSAPHPDIVTHPLNDTSHAGHVCAPLLPTHRMSFGPRRAALSALERRHELDQQHGPDPHYGLDQQHGPAHAAPTAAAPLDSHDASPDR
jgi:hypothetical protein